MSENGGQFTTLNGGRRLILIVDGEAENRSVLTHALEGHYDVLCAATGREALDVIYEKRDALSLVLVIGGFVLDAVLPLAPGKIKPEKQYPVILRKLLAKTDYSDAPEAARILALERSRKGNRIVSILLFAVGAAVFLCFVLQSSHWHQSDINGSMVKAMWIMLATLSIPFCFSIYRCFNRIC